MMNSKNNEVLSTDELDWIQLRKELDEIRGQEKKLTFMSKETWYIPAGLALTVVCFSYGLYHMHHPTKSTIGAYARIFSQAVTGIGAVHVFLKFSNEGKRSPESINMNYSD